MTDPRNTLAPDTLVEGKYRIKRLLAEGGMGAVYHAIQEPLGRDVAFKVLKPQDDTPQKRAQREKRFLREAAVSGKLNHPNTIVILDYGKLPNAEGFFLAMEFLEGKSLREVLIERGSLGTRVTLHIAMQMASSLADAHRQGAVHRDLKPPNVMLVLRGEDPYFVKVVDFGLVKELEPEEGEEELTAENHLVGSPMYMAPERFLSSTADSPAVDVYSLGIMMYEMLVGRPPFIREGDSTLQAIMMQHIQEDVPPMRQLRPDLELAPGVEQLVMRCLAKHPDDRVQSMDALLTLLKACAAGAGMAVASPVEDTGAFAPPPGLSRISGPLTAATIEDPGPPAEVQTEQHPRRAISPIVVAAALAGLLVAIALAALLLVPTAQLPTHLVVNSNPSGATVSFAGTPVGSTPYDAPMELAGPVTITIHKEGFQPFEHRVLPKPGEEVAVTAELRAIAVEAAGTTDAAAPEVPLEVAPTEEKTVKPKVERPPKRDNLDIKLAR